jgi:SAM-dependent methyltransferase
MRLRTVATLVESGQVGVLLTLARTVRLYYRVPFLAACIESGLLALLRDGPVPLARVAAGLGIPPGDGLAAWLDFGVRLGELRQGRDGYALRSRFARRLADPANDAAAALVCEAASLHARLLTETPARLREARPFTLADQDGPLVARSSRLLEPFVCEAIDDVVPAEGALRLLDVGCGAGMYLRHALERNPALRGVGLELQPEVAALARRNLASERATIEVGDVRAYAAPGAFDVVFLFNNVNYFPLGARVDVLRHVRGFLRPGGRLLVTIGCAGSEATDVLSLWGAMTEGCSPLPTPAEMVAQLEAAGFRPVRRRNLIPGYGYFAFVGHVEAPAAGPC